jgi:lipooligosaccharide transport system ATP-binding protein
MADKVIEVEHGYKTYESVTAVKDLSFQVKPSQCFSFLGPNGAGKTTMMKILYGKAKPDKREDSRYRVFGFDPAENELSIKTISGVVPQDNNLDVELNVRQNLRIFARFYHLEGKEMDRRIDRLLEFMELSDKRTAKIRELSGGMQRRLTIVRALLNDPRLLILDEPTTGLDPQVRQLIWDKLRSLKKEGVTILLTTHYMEEAFQLADEIIIMDKGEKILEGKPQNLIEEHIEPHVLELNSVSKSGDAEAGIPREKYRKEESSERILYYSRELEMLQNMSSRLEPGDFFLRQVNLEDLFLKATGRQLNEIQ